jgi:DNA polymerase I-like protein with 3'-5' exonuclease and polymerase domains
MKSKNQLILIDGNALLHRAFHAYPFLSTSSGETVNAVFGFTTMLLQVLERFKPKYIVVTFDKKGPTFRHQEFTQYKAQRKPMDDGLASQIARTYEVVETFNIPIFAVEGYEADDLIGTIAHRATKMDEIDEVIIVTGDRDLLQLLDDKVKAFMPGRTFGEGSIIDEEIFKEKYGLETPRQLIDFKALRGDASDNIPGVAGIGDVGATKLLKEFHTLENLYSHLNDVDPKNRKKLEESAEMAGLSKKLATIDTDAPIQFDLTKCETESYDKEKVVALFEQLEFKSLMKKIGNGKVGEGAVVKAKKEESNGEVKDIKETMREYLKDQPDAIVNLDLQMIDVLKRMSENGLLIDTKVLSELSEDFSKKLETITKQIHEYAGHEFNINSSKQLSEVLFDHLKLPVIKKTKTGRSTDEEVLQELSSGSPIASSVLEYRELYKLKSTYVDALPKYIMKDGRIHGAFHLDVAATGRLSSTDPNLQNIPIRGQWGTAIRKAFVSEKGFDMVSADYSQIELRILAHLSGDEGMRGIFAEDKDIHQSTAALIFNIPVDQVTKDQRRSAKTINFGLMYGMGAHALSRDLKITFAEAQAFIKAYFEAFPMVKKWIDKTLKEGEECGYVETIMGRRRYLPELKSQDRRLKSAGERMAINMPAQGTQAEMIKVAMVHIDSIIQSQANHAKEIKMVLQVHDELLFEIREGSVKQWIEVIHKEMCDALPLSVPVKVGVNIGKSWGDMKEYSK